MFPTHYRILVASVLSELRHFFRLSSSPLLRVFPEQNSRWINYYLNQAPLWYYVILFFGDSGPLVIVLAQWTVRINRSSWLLCWVIAIVDLRTVQHQSVGAERRSADHHSITNLPEVKEHALCCGQRNILPRGHHNNTSTSTKVRDSLLGEIETSPSETKNHTIIFWIKTYTTFCCVFSKAKILFFLKANLSRFKNHLICYFLWCSILNIILQFENLDPFICVVVYLLRV